MNAKTESTAIPQLREALRTIFNLTEESNNCSDVVLKINELSDSALAASSQFHKPAPVPGGTILTDEPRMLNRSAFISDMYFDIYKLELAEGLAAVPGKGDPVDGLVLPPVAAPVSQRIALYKAALDCGHSIDENKVVLHRDKRKEGNALSQLADRLEAATAAPGSAGSGNTNNNSVNFAAPVVPCPTGSAVIAMLKRAMDQAELPNSYRAFMVGYFSNEWNKSIAAPAPVVPVDRNAVPSGDALRAIVRSASTSASDGASPQELVLAGWNAALKSAAPASVPNDEVKHG